MKTSPIVNFKDPDGIALAIGCSAQFVTLTAWSSLGSREDEVVVSPGGLESP